MKKRNLNLNKNNYNRIRETALSSYKNASVTSDLVDVFLPACWTSAVITELQSLGFIEDVNWISIDFKENLKVESDDE